MLSLLKYLKGYTKQCILGPLFKMLEACFELTVPIIMAKIIDVGIANSDSGYILRMCGLLVLMGVFGLISAVTAQHFAASAAYGFGTA
ncbi:MAG: ABC transporter ATP-binding protein, partial [Clostridiales bacterium]|nr:ABC transporter ATP-binding protein [Clostridiales bacterium]